MWHHGLEVENIRGIASPHGQTSHSYARTCVSGSGSRGQSLEILHPPNHCPHCHAYKVHVINASLQGDPPYERDRTGTILGYSDSNLGFSSEYDIHRELYQVKTNLRRVRRERDEAVSLSTNFQNEVARLESQLQEMKDRLLAVEMAYGHENQLRNVNFLGGESRGDELLREIALAEQVDEPFSLRNDKLRLDTDLGMGMDDWVIEHPIIQTDIISNASWSDSDDYELSQQLHLMTQEDENHSEDDDSSSDAPQNQANSTLEVYCSDSSIDSPSSLSASSLSASDWAGNQSDDSSSSSVRPTSSDEELHNTLKLMASAHNEGNITALIKIRKLIAQSERTPRHERTEAQKYLLLNWRSPSLSGRNNHSNLVLQSQLQPAPAVLPSSSQGRLEIFVDASGSGIGFVFGTYWLAWTFKKSPNIPLGGDGNIVMSWAELLAVEVGLRALIDRKSVV